MRTHRSAAALSLSACLALLLAGCGGGSGSKAASDDSKDAATPTASSSAGARPGGAAAKPGAKATSGSKGTTRTGAPAAGSTTTAPSSGGQQAAPRFTPPGAYTYDVNGTVTAGSTQKSSGSATLTVDKPVGEKQHSSFEGERGGTEQDVVHRADGTYLARLVIASFGKEFRPAKPVLTMPVPAQIGKAWSWTMKSTDGKTTASLTAKIVRRETVTVGGQAIKAWVIEGTLKLTGDFTYTDQRTSWHDDSRLLEVKERSRGSGSYGGMAFTTDMTSTLRSVRPS